MSVPKVSVVVPAYNCGRHMDKLVSSLRRQSLPADEFEAVFVDDGSTDGTGARLDALATAHPNFRVLHIPNSGWPSRPRNVGVEHARGEYVFFADDDDWFGDEALERLYACAKANDADVVIGKMTGHGRAVPRELFRKNRFQATLANAPLIDSLTCHKLFRRSFLNEHELRFSEGPLLRLEDHRMVVRAYLLSRRTSVLSDYTCYHHRKRADAGNVTARPLDPAEYFAALREALDVVDAHVEPGPLRDRLHRRWLRNEMISRLRGQRLLDAPQDWAGQVVEEVRQVIRDRFAPGVAAGLPPLQRVVAHLAEHGRVADLRRLARWESGIDVTATVERQEMTGGTLTVDIAAHLQSEGRPVALSPDGDRELLVLPVDGVDPALRDLTATPGPSRVDVVARRRQTNEEIFLPVTLSSERVPDPTEPGGRVYVVHRATATIDTAALNSGRTQGTWFLKARVTSSGWTADARLPLFLHFSADGADPVVRAKDAFWSRVRGAVVRRVGRDGVPARLARSLGR